VGGPRAPGPARGRSRCVFRGTGAVEDLRKVIPPTGGTGTDRAPEACPRGAVRPAGGEPRASIMKNMQEVDVTSPRRADRDHGGAAG